MDESRFDELSRRLAAATTRRGGIKAALGALLGGTAGGGALEAEAKKKRKKKCSPECAAGQTCVKGACVCDDGGTVCGAECCANGQRCEGGQCADRPNPGACIALGEPCKGTGRPCCDGLACASGQGGTNDIACYVAKTGRCASTAECTYGTRCEDGVCAGIPQPPPNPGGCVADGASGCTGDADCCSAGSKCDSSGICGQAKCGTIPVSNDPAENGSALKAALDAAVGKSGTVIQLAAGAYKLPSGVSWTSGDVVIEACPDAAVEINGPNATAMFSIQGGSFTIKKLTLNNKDGGNSSYGLTASGTGTTARIENCVITGMVTAVSGSLGGVVTIVGGDFTGNTKYSGADFSFQAVTNGSPGSFICEGNPVAAGCCTDTAINCGGSGAVANCSDLNATLIPAACNCSCTS